LPTARLERLFAGHLDTCAYRLDAWQQGFMHYGLALSRYGVDSGKPVIRRGVLLGAFGWLESVRPRKRQLEPVKPAPGIAPSFFKAPAPQPESVRTEELDPMAGHVHEPGM